MASRALTVGAVVVASLLLGAATSWAQGFLPDAMSSLANSPSGWTVLTALLVAAARPTLPFGAALGVLSFVTLVLGYTLASHLRGLFYDPVLWGTVGVLAGPFIGVATAALFRGSRLHAAMGAGVLAGVLLADGIYGLTVVAETTSPVYWSVCLGLGAAGVIAMAARLRSPRLVGLLVAATVASTGVLSAGYAALGGL